MLKNKKTIGVWDISIRIIYFCVDESLNLSKLFKFLININFENFTKKCETIAILFYKIFLKKLNCKTVKSYKIDPCTLYNELL